MSKYPGRVLSATPPAVSTTGASGIWTQEEVAQYNAEGVWPVQPLPYDPYFQDTVLLLHGDGNQGATNFSNISDPVYLAFKDNSDNNFPITVNGDAYGDNFGPYALEDGNWSNYFDGSGDYLDTPTNQISLDVTQGDFTIEAWVYRNASGAEHYICSQRGAGSGYELRINSNNTLAGFYTGGSSVTSTGTVPANQWVHICWVRSSSTASLYINGTRDGTGSFSNGSSAYTSYALRIGYTTAPPAGYMNGYVSNFRLVKGSAVYDPTSTTITVPTAPLTAITNTSILTCQSNRFVDNSTNNFAITAAGNVATKVFNPFGEVPDGVNGSGFFDGTGDYLFIPSDSNLFFSSGDWTIEFWMYAPNVTTYQDLIGLNYNTNQSSIASARLTVTGGQIQMLASTDGANWTVNTTIGSVSANTWTHIAYTRSSTTLTLWINGISAGTASISGALYAGTYGSQIGNVYWSGGNFYYSGNISNVRVVKGTAVYTSAFTPPASPLTAVSGTELLTCQYAGTVRNVGFIDSGPYDFPITRYGNTTQGSFSPFSKPDGRWGNYFDGSGDYLQMSDNASFQFGSNDWTVEFWAYATSTLTANYIVSQWSASSKGFVIGTGVSGSGRMSYGVSTTGTDNVYVSDPDSFPINQFVHVAAVRSGTTLALFINGSRKVTYTLSAGVSLFNSSNLIRIGAHSDGSPSTYWPGYVTNLRSVIGANSPYDATQTTITVPTAPLTAISGTSFLTCQSNRFKDNSTNNFTITAAGDAKVTPFSPFPITTEYSPSVNGGSAYFDGSDDYLNLNNVLAFGTSDWSWETWVYPTSFASINTIVDFRPSNTEGAYFLLNIQTNGKFRVYVSSAARIDADNAINLNEWTHVCVQEVSGVMTMYVNGVAQTTTWTNTTNFLTASNRPIIGRFGYNTTGPFAGYMAGIRVLIGGYAYDTFPFDPPTAPPTAITNTSLLCNFTNAGIYDNTAFNDLETVGNAQVDTSVVKFGTGSMKFDGNGDYLEKPVDPLYAFGTGDFTIECWYWKSANGVNGYDSIISTATDGNGTNGYFVELSATRGFYFRIGSTNYANTTTTWINDSTWHHFALSRSGTTLRYFIDGEIKSTFTSSDQINANGAVRIGASPNASNVPTYFFNGYIDDLRITKGVARYTTTFDPPTIAFRNIGA